jgi:NAD(P)-dependent dehydrogenase (short-subunit alcohol dehydrogenase family)
MQHIVITGAEGGLGRPVTRKFLDRGYHVHAIISPDGNRDFMKDGHLSVYRADLRKEDEAEGTVRKIADIAEQIEGAVLIVGGFSTGTLQETELGDVEQMYRLNFVTAYNSARPLFVQMEKNDSGGQIIFIGARPGMEPKAARGMVAYALSKSLVFRLSEIINEAGKKWKITSSVIVPSIIDTPANRRSMPDADHSKWVTGEEIAENILHLFSPAGSRLRESVIKVYGES